MASVILAQYNPPFGSPGGASPWKGAATANPSATFSPTATQGAIAAKRVYLTDVTLTNLGAAGADVILQEGNGSDPLHTFVGSSTTVRVSFSAAREYQTGTVVATTSGSVNVAVQGTQQ